VGEHFWDPEKFKRLQIGILARRSVATGFNPSYTGLKPRNDGRGVAQPG
jgi:hypothetical protein